MLKSISYEFECVIIATNQATQVPDQDKFSPYLGYFWSLMGNSCIRLERILNRDGDKIDVRKFEIEFSPGLRKNSCKFYVTKNGIE